MFVNGLLQLIDAGVIKRRVFDDLVTQQAVNDGSLLPDELPGGTLMTGGFFLGPTRFYEQLRRLARAARRHPHGPHRPHQPTRQRRPA